ncbi:MAG: FCD domain-containing protein [Streptosporangiales bacterium]|nr:FCD domain-containing protein [Streptosporangiales bacterium]
MGQRGGASERAGSARTPAGTRRLVTAVTTPSRPQQAAKLLRDAIVTGRVLPGEQLKQDQLCAELELSPGPLREALRQLESEGLVTHIPNRGVFVAHIPTEEWVDVLLPVRLLLEAHAFTKAAHRLTDEQLAELEGLVQAMLDAATTADFAAINEADMRFHEMVVHASGQEHTVQLWRTVSPRIRAQFYRLAPQHPRPNDIALEHRDLLDALRTKDPEAIHRTLEEHIITSSKAMLEEEARHGPVRHPTA